MWETLIVLTVLSVSGSIHEAIEASKAMSVW